PSPPPRSTPFPYTTLFRSTLAVKFSTAWSFLVPEIMNIDEAELKSWMEDRRLSEFAFDLEKLNSRRDHVLSDKEEKLMARAGEVDRKSTRLNSSHVSISYA